MATVDALTDRGWRAMTGSGGARRVEPVRLAAEPETALAEVVRYVRTVAHLARLPDKQTYRLRLAVEELVANVLTHGKAPDLVELAGGVDPHRVWLRMVDSAAAFDPTAAAAPTDLDRPLAHRKPGGLGLYLARSMVDEMSYEYVGGRNRTTIVLHR
jgi:sigma-B regulation protein RsbU (phosphoserine phosphatase)